MPDVPNALVFRHRRGGLLPIEQYRRALDKACAEVGIEGLVPRGLRHATASLAIGAGANVKVVQRMLGHATAAMTLDRYGHLFGGDPASPTHWVLGSRALRYHCGIRRRSGNLEEDISAGS